MRGFWFELAVCIWTPVTFGTRGDGVHLVDVCTFRQSRGFFGEGDFVNEMECCLGFFRRVGREIGEDCAKQEAYLLFVASLERCRQALAQAIFSSLSDFLEFFGILCRPFDGFLRLLRLFAQCCRCPGSAL